MNSEMADIVSKVKELKSDLDACKLELKRKQDQLDQSQIERGKIAKDMDAHREKVEVLESKLKEKIRRFSLLRSWWIRKKRN